MSTWRYGRNLRREKLLPLIAQAQAIVDAEPMTRRGHEAASAVAQARNSMAMMGTGPRFADVVKFLEDVIGAE